MGIQCMFCKERTDITYDGGRDEGVKAYPIRDKAICHLCAKDLLKAMREEMND